MKHFIFSLVLAFGGAAACAQTTKPPPTMQVGVEIDALPYATGGYFIAGWAGKGLWRFRALTAAVNKPDWTTRPGFSKHHVKAYAVLVDRFLRPGWKGWWIGAGPVYWKSSIQTDLHLQKARFEHWLLNGSLGYHLSLGHHFYLSPWAGMSLRVAGDQDVPVDDKMYTLPLLNLEASLKLGLFF